MTGEVHSVLYDGAGCGVEGREAPEAGTGRVVVLCPPVRYSKALVRINTRPSRFGVPPYLDPHQYRAGDTIPLYAQRSRHWYSLW